MYAQSGNFGVGNAQQAFVTDGSPLAERSPDPVPEALDCERLHSLASADVLLKHKDVYRRRFIELVLAYIPRLGVPQGGPVLYEISPESLLKVSGELSESDGIGLVDMSPAVRRNVQQKHRVAAHRLVVDVREFFQALDLRVLLRVVEPARTDGYIDLRRIPEQFSGFLQHRSAAEILGLGIDSELLVYLRASPLCVRGEYGRAPLRLPAHSAFIAHPAGIVAHIGRYGGRLNLAYGRVDGFPVVHLLAAVRALAVRAVEPDLIYFPVVGEKLGELRYEIFVVLGGIPVAGRVTVPGREIDSELHSVLFAGVAHLPHDVPLTVFPGR